MPQEMSMEARAYSFASMPSAKDREGNFRDICFPTTKKLRAEINAAVVEAYNAALEKGPVARDAEKPSATGRLKKAEKASKAAAKAPKAEKAASDRGGDAR